MNPRHPPTTPETFRCPTKELQNGGCMQNAHDENVWFRGLFGVTAEVCAIAWDQIAEHVPLGGEPLHLLWALFFLKVYATESVNRTLLGVDRKTFRKWPWKVVHLLADIEVITWENRYSKRIANGMVSVDGSDFRIYEPYPFEPKWYSHKFHGSGLRYEVGVSISTGCIVWVNGPFRCGSHSDLNIFQINMKNCLDADEFVITDGGYSDERCRKIGENLKETKLYSITRARHETLSRRMKQFNVLHNFFRHRLSLHSACFHAVAKLTQLMIEPLTLSSLSNISCKVYSHHVINYGRSVIKISREAHPITERREDEKQCHIAEQ